MKKLRSRLWAKVTAYILLAVFGAAATLGAVGIPLIFHEIYGGGNLLSPSCDFYSSSIFVRLAENTASEIFNTYIYNSDAEQEISRLYSEKNSNATVSIVNKTEGASVFYNKAENSELRYEGEFIYSTSDSDTYFGDVDYGAQHFKIKNTDEINTIIVKLYLPEVLTVNDDFYNAYQLYMTVFNFRFAIIAIFALSVIFAVLLMIFIISSAGHRRDTDEIVLNMYDRIPLEITALFSAVPLFTVAGLANGYIFIASIPVLAVSAALFLQTFAARVKKGRWYINTVVYRILRLAKKTVKKLFSLLIRFFRRLPVIWKTVLLYTCLFFINTVLVMLYFYSYRRFVFFALLVIINLSVLAVLCLISVNIKKIKNASFSISQGNFENKINTGDMLIDFKDIAENLNNISVVNASAVEAARKSERMKAELITNVSHDIKTPLTSIINYVDLLKKEPIKDEKAKEYIEILNRHSLKLKKLTEDLVDASKASTGNIPVNFAVTDIVEFINQADGEYREKFEKSKLSLILSAPAQPIYINADGKLMWRIIDNLLSNALKYSQENTRVYVTLKKVQSKAVISIKNISREILNISADELMERFVRGDSSRNTEGSGLGLSIAKSLAVLQNGSLNIEIDGDLFKAELAFDVISNV